MYFGIKSYLKSTRNHTVKHANPGILPYKENAFDFCTHQPKRDGHFKNMTTHTTWNGKELTKLGELATSNSEHKV
jgi:hypothetical protein